MYLGGLFKLGGGSMQNQNFDFCFEFTITIIFDILGQTKNLVRLFAEINLYYIERKYIIHQVIVNLWRRGEISLILVSSLRAACAWLKRSALPQPPLIFYCVADSAFNLLFAHSVRVTEWWRIAATYPKVLSHHNSRVLHWLTNSSEHII